MKNNNKNYNYWIKEGDKFNSFYKIRANTNPQNFVSSFLNKRTQILLNLFKNQHLGKVLDIGCGSGVHMKILVNQCSFIAGVDFSSKMIELAKKNMSNISNSKWEFKNADVHKLPYKDKTFDTIISLGLLDYVDNPLIVLKECFRVLKGKCIILFSIPKEPSLFFLLRTKFGNRIKKLFFNLPPISNTYTELELKDLLTKSSFEPIYITSVWSTMWMVKAQKK